MKKKGINAKSDLFDYILIGQNSVLSERKKDLTGKILILVHCAEYK